VELGVDPGALADGLTVSVAPDANVLTFAYDAPDPVTAQRRAQALAEAYVEYRNDDESQSRSKTATAEARAAAAATANAHATLVTPAYLPGAPQARPVWIDLGIGLVLGLLLGVGTALVRDRLSDRIRGRADFEKITGRTVLATVPRTRRPRGPDAARPVLLRAPESPAAESYRYLRSRLQPLLARDGAVAVLVASADEGEGRSSTAANLALALATAGRRVVLVDADLRHPAQHTIFGLGDEPGLTAVLAGETGLTDALQTGPAPRLRLLAAGAGADRATDLLEGPRLGRLLRTLRQQCDVIVLDSSAVLSVSDAIALAAVSDHVLLVGDYRRSTRAGVARALTELGEVVHGNVSGVLVNAPKSAGGLVPRPRDGVSGTSSGTPEDAFALLDGPDERPAPVFGSAAVPGLTSPASTVYTSSSAHPTAPATTPNRTEGSFVIGPGKSHHAAGGPVKARINGVDNGAAVPAQRGGADPR
jgi:capsular exopolysaccharide synthesis family protein